jgi:hypothetical protein
VAVEDLTAAESVTGHDRPVFGQSWPSLGVQLSSGVSDGIASADRTGPVAALDLPAARTRDRLPGVGAAAAGGETRQKPTTVTGFDLHLSQMLSYVAAMVLAVVRGRGSARNTCAYEAKGTRIPDPHTARTRRNA